MVGTVTQKSKKGIELSTYIFLIVDLFNRHAQAYALTKEQKTAEGCANLLVHGYIHTEMGMSAHVVVGSRGGVHGRVAKVVYEMLID